MLHKLAVKPVLSYLFCPVFPPPLSLLAFKREMVSNTHGCTLVAEEGAGEATNLLRPRSLPSSFASIYVGVNTLILQAVISGAALTGPHYSMEAVRSQLMACLRWNPTVRSYAG